MNRIKVRLDTQSDVIDFVTLANQIPEDVYLLDNSYNKVNGKSLLGCLYSLEFSELFVESESNKLSNVFNKFLY